MAYPKYDPHNMCKGALNKWAASTICIFGIFSYTIALFTYVVFEVRCMSMIQNRTYRKNKSVKSFSIIMWLYYSGGCYWMDFSENFH